MEEPSGETDLKGCTRKQLFVSKSHSDMVEEVLKIDDYDDDTPTFRD